PGRRRDPAGQRPRRGPRLAGAGLRGARRLSRPLLERAADRTSARVGRSGGDRRHDRDRPVLPGARGGTHEHRGAGDRRGGGVRSAPFRHPDRGAAEPGRARRSDPLAAGDRVGLGRGGPDAGPGGRVGEPAEVVAPVGARRPPGGRRGARLRRVLRARGACGARGRPVADRRRPHRLHDRDARRDRGRASVLQERRLQPGAARGGGVARRHRQRLLPRRDAQDAALDRGGADVAVSGRHGRPRRGVPEGASPRDPARRTRRRDRRDRADLHRLMGTPRRSRSRTRRVLAAALLVSLSAALPGQVASGRVNTPNQPRPNVIVIVTDDQEYRTLSAMPTVSSRLVGQGIRFSNFYVVNPTCCPSRASILTGNYAHTTGVYSNTTGFQQFNDSSTVATALDAAGYDTALVGKYLNGYSGTYVPPGWDHWLGKMTDGRRHFNDDRS